MALTVLFEAAIQLARVNDKRAARRQADEALDVDQASEIDVRPSAVDPEPSRLPTGASDDAT